MTFGTTSAQDTAGPVQHNDSGTCVSDEHNEKRQAFEISKMTVDNTMTLC